MSEKRIRDMARQAEKVGLAVVEKSTNKGHIIFLLRAPNGVEQLFTMAGTPGDNRGDLNEIAAWKRFHRDNPATALGEALKRVADTPEFKVIAKLAPPPAPITNPEPAAEPAAQQEPSMATTPKISRKHRRISATDFYRLAEHLKTLDISTITSWSQLSAVCGDALKLNISESTLKEVADVVGKKLPKLTNTPRKSKPIETLATSLITVMDALQISVPPDLLALAGEVRP